MAAATEVVEALARVAESGEAALDDDAILDQAPVVARGLVPTQADALVGEVRGKASGPEVRRLAEVAVGVDDHVVGRHRFDRGFAHASHDQGPPPEEQLRVSYRM